MRYSLLAGGKRLRPVLCLAAADVAGGANGEAGDIDIVCCALECMHTYSLIHDDLPAMDDDALRRGLPTCHRAFDEATAILAGDGLQALAFELLANATSIAPGIRLRLIATLAAASGGLGMVGGQAIDLACVGRHMSRAALEHMHRLKTGALIRAAVRMGALLADTDQTTLTRLDDYAAALGLAFQIHDDILDCTGSTQRLGKQPGADAALAKPSFVSLLGLEAARALAAELGEAAHATLEPLGRRAMPLRELARFTIARDH